MKRAKTGHFRNPEKPMGRKREKAQKLTAEARAQLLAGLPEGEVPAFLTETTGFDMELQIWRDLSPDLRRINSLARLDRFGFAMYCVHMADWIRATLDIKAKGETYKARSTITKDWLLKMNPMVKVREIAEKHLLELGARFGLDPTSRFKLVGLQAGLAGQGFLPFGDGADKPAPDAPQEEPAARPTGFLADNSSTPPRPN